MNIEGFLNNLYSKTYVRDIFVFVILTGISFVLGMNNGFDMCLDSYNYHIYNPWAFFHNRIGIDVLPADIQTYFNPLIDIPAYLLIKYLNDFPKLALGLNNCYYGIFIFIFYKITDVFFRVKGIEKYICMTACIILAMTAPILLNEVNLLSNDVQIGIAVLASIFILFKYLYLEDSKKRTFMISLAGLIMGIITGLKITSCFYCFSFFLTLLIVSPDIKKPFKAIVYFCLSIVLGFLITDGFWLWIVYSHFKNPFFPYFNNIFKSPYADFSMVLDSDYAHLRPRSIFEFVYYPFYGAFERRMRGYERNFFDARYIFSYISMYFAMIFVWYKNIWNSGNFMDKKYEKFIFVFVILSYSAGMLIFGQYRYFIPLNALTGILLLILGYSLFKSKMLMTVVLALIFSLTLMLDVRINDKAIRNLPEGKLFYAEDMKIPDNSLVILASRAVAAMAITQNENVKYIYLSFPKNEELTPGSYFVPDVYYKSDYMEKTLKEELLKHKDSTYVMYRSNIALRDMDNYHNALNAYTDNKFKKIEDCRVIGHNNNPAIKVKYKICKVVIGD